MHSVICEVHERDRERAKNSGQAFTKDERHALIEELFRSLSAQERAVLDSETAEVA